MNILAICIGGFTLAVMVALKKPSVEEAYVKLLEDICSESTTAVKQRKKGEEIPLMLGVRHGYTEYQLKHISLY